MTTSSRRLALRTLCAVLCAALLLGAPLLGGGSSSARAAQPTPDFVNYYCPNEGAFLAFDWTKQMPYNGWLGLTYGFTNKDVQAYDARQLNGSGGGLNWGFQAQDGSFVCRMYVMDNQNTLSFVNCRGSWPVTNCFAL